MWQPNISRKKVSLVHVWASIVLIALCIIISLTPMITLRTGDKIETINEYISKVAGAEDLKIPETVEVSMPKLLDSVNVISKMVKVAQQTAESTQSEDVQKAIDELTALLKSEEGKETLILAFAFVATIVDGFDMDGKIGLGGVLNALVTIMSVLFVLVFTFFVPFIFIIMGIVALFRALTNVKTPENVSGKVGALLPATVSLPLTYMLLQSFVPGMKFASGALLLWLFSLISVVLGALVTRARKYDENDYKYSLIVQGTAILGLIGYVVFFFNIIKTNLFQEFVTGPWADVMVTSEVARSEGVEVGNGHMIDALLIFIAVVFILGSVAYFEKSAGRLACAVKKKRMQKISDSGLFSAITILLAYVLPVVVMGRSHDYSNMPALEVFPSISNIKEVTFLTLTTAESAALTASLFGIIIMLVAEIGLIVLKKIFCPEMDKEDMLKVITGKALTPEEKLEKAQAVVDAAQAEVAAAQEDELARARRLVAEADAKAAKEEIEE